MALFRSNLGAVLTLTQKASRNGVRAAAVVVQNQAKKNVRGGFKSGDFVTGNLMNKITHEVRGGEGIFGGEIVALVGTAVDYGAYWELGHTNKFTGKYERKPWLKPAFDATMKEQQDAAAAAMAQTMRLAALGRLM